MNDKDLYRKAQEAAHNYKKVYGIWPEKIGIHHRRIAEFYEKHSCIIFPVLPPTPVNYFTIEITDISPMLTIHRVNFEAVMGMVRLDEVYLPVPGVESAIMSGEQIAAMAAKSKGLMNKHDETVEYWQH